MIHFHATDIIYCPIVALKPIATTGQPMSGVVNVTDSVTATDEDLDNAIISTEVLSSTVSLQTTSTVEISPSSTLMTTTTTDNIPYSTSRITSFSSTIAPSLSRTNTTQSQTSLRISMSISQLTTTQQVHMTGNYNNAHIQIKSEEMTNVFFSTQRYLRH